MKKRPPPPRNRFPVLSAWAISACRCRDHRQPRLRSDRRRRERRTSSTRSTNGEIHIVEPDLDMRGAGGGVAAGKLRADDEAGAGRCLHHRRADAVQGRQAAGRLLCDAAARAIAPVLKKGDLVVLESTSPVGTTEQISRWIAELRPDLKFPHEHGEDADIHDRLLPRARAARQGADANWSTTTASSAASRGVAPSAPLRSTACFVGARCISPMRAPPRWPSCPRTPIATSTSPSPTNCRWSARSWASTSGR